MKQQVNPVVGIMIAILVVAVIGLGYMALSKPGPAPTIPMSPGAGNKPIALPGMDGTRASGGGTGTIGGGMSNGGLSLPGGTAPGGGGGIGGPSAPVMPGAPTPP